MTGITRQDDLGPQMARLGGNDHEERSAPVKRRSVPFSWTTACLLACLGLTLLAGCAGHETPTCREPAAAAYAAEPDSLGLEEFLALPEDQREERRRRANNWLKRAGSARSPADRIAALTSAAGLAPDNPDTWLRLAHFWRWIGDYVRTSTYLENAAAAVRKLDSRLTMSEKRQAQRRTALARAWLHYDRGEYHEALRWARAGNQVSPGDKWIRQIRGLIEGSLNHRSMAHELAGDILRADSSDPDGRWVLATLERSQQRYREAFNYISGLRPDHEHSAECFRDMGEIAEHLGEWSYAQRWYAESAHALPFKDTSCLTGIFHQRLDPDLPDVRLPVWLAYDRYYVTGSLSAYAALALKNYERLTDPGDREFWAGQVVNAAGILLRKDMDRTWSLRARGLVFAGKGIAGRGLLDLRRTEALLAEEDRVDSRVEAGIGHLLLVEGNAEDALPHLEKAVDLDGGDAQAWSDMGLGLIMAGDRREAAKALTRAIELKPDLVAAWYNRGLMHLHGGELDQAEADLEKAASLAPGNSEVAKLLQQVHLRRKQE